jgi:endonuclease YncB( thermonuclease family)
LFTITAMPGNIRQFRTNNLGEPDKLRMLLDEPPKKRGVPWFWLVVTLSLLLGFAAVYLRHDVAAALKPKPGAPLQLSAGQVQVVDGDTIRVHGQQADIRLMGFSTPETVRARCDAERERGYTAMRRLRAIVESADLALQPVPCACPSNAEGPEACNMGRRCGILRANGWDVGERLIAEGLALRLACNGAACPQLTQPWCDAR